MDVGPAGSIPGVVFDIQRYSIHDGPGIRTLVFLKGCPLRCLWCCNPESQSRQPEVQFFAAKCAQCGACVAACPEGAVNPDLSVGGDTKIDRARCTACGRCVEACPNGALAMVGTVMTAAAVVEAVKRDARFYRRSHGGVTLSGGEPLAQPEFARAILSLAYDAGIHTTVETCGAFAWEAMAAALPYVDLVLFDLKHSVSADHRAHTSGTLEPIVLNLRRLATARKSLVIRVPLVPGYNTDNANLRGIARLAVETGALEVNLMPFHQLGKEKYRRLGRPYALSGLSDTLSTPEGRAQVQAARELFASEGLKVTVGG